MKIDRCRSIKLYNKFPSSIAYSSSNQLTPPLVVNVAPAWALHPPRDPRRRAAPAPGHTARTSAGRTFCEPRFRSSNFGPATFARRFTFFSKDTGVVGIRIQIDEMARSKLKSMLDNEKGRDFKLEKQRKLEKEARKRKELNKAGKKVEEKEEGGAKVAEEEKKVPAKKAAPTKKGKVQDTKAEPEWETDDSEEDDASDDDDEVDEQTALDLSRFDDSESDVSGDDEVDDEEGETLGAAGDDDDEDEDEDEEEDDIALSDIESLADDDKADLIPHQRLTINNTSALTAALNRIKLPYSKLAFSEYMSLTTDEDVEIADVDDDLNRELAFYKQSLSAVKDARGLLKKEGAPFSRPADYFAEMVKDDEHMGKIKQKLIDEAAGKKASAEARKQRDLKKFGKQVQVAKLQERAKEKRDTMEKIGQLKRSTYPRARCLSYMPWHPLTALQSAPAQT